jgi:hypothetical protein
MAGDSSIGLGSQRPLVSASIARRPSRGRTVARTTESASGLVIREPTGNLGRLNEQSPVWLAQVEWAAECAWRGPKRQSHAPRRAPGTRRTDPQTDRRTGQRVPTRPEVAANFVRISSRLPHTPIVHWDPSF